VRAPAQRVREGADGNEDLSAFIAACKDEAALSSVSPNVSASPIPRQTSEFESSLLDMPHLELAPHHPHPHHHSPHLVDDDNRYDQHHHEPLLDDSDARLAVVVGGHENDDRFANNNIDEQSDPPLVARRKRGRPKGTFNRRRGEDEFVEVQVSGGVVGALEQHRLASNLPPDVRNYQPLLERADRANPRPKRVRVLPLAYWKGEKPIYVVRTRDDNLPEVAGYGIVNGAEDRSLHGKKETKKKSKKKGENNG
jgi:hypothetical protein